MTFVWTEEAVERLKSLHEEGLSGAELAARLGGGLTRSAIFGKLHRLGLTGKRGPATQTQTSRLAASGFAARGIAASGFAERRLAAKPSMPSWPGGASPPSRPSTNLRAATLHVDARITGSPAPGHDGKRYGPFRFNFARSSRAASGSSSRAAAAASLQASLPAPPGPLPPPSLRLSIVEVGLGQCRFIAGDDGLACGHKTHDGGSWCPAHRAIVFAPEAE